MKVGTSLILGSGVTFSKWGWYGHLQFSGIPEICYAGQVINRYNYQIPFRSTVFLSLEKKCMILTQSSEDQDRLLLGLNLHGLIKLIAQLPGTTEFYQKLLLIEILVSARSQVILRK